MLDPGPTSRSLPSKSHSYGVQKEESERCALGAESLRDGGLDGPRFGGGCPLEGARKLAAMGQRSRNESEQAACRFSHLHPGGAPRWMLKSAAGTPAPAHFGADTQAST